MENSQRILRETASAASTILKIEFRDGDGPWAESGVPDNEHRIIEAIEKLGADEILSFSVEEFAGKFATSPRHLNQLFHKAFGFSICGLKMEIRLLKAEALLRNNKTSLINVSQKSGFNHPSLFNACFQKRFGVTPGKWWTLHGGRAAPPYAQPSSRLIRFFVLHPGGASSHPSKSRESLSA
jgi:AraC-like DNA-binding protein